MTIDTSHPRERRGDEGRPHERADVGEALARMVADTYALYFQTQTFHWNVRGPHFATLHALFEQQYDGLAEAVDELAERLRAIGRLAPTSLREIAEHASIPLDHGAPPARGMVEVLLRANEHLSRAARDVGALADERGDPVTHDMMVERAAAHDEAAWMLRATLED